MNKRNILLIVILLANLLFISGAVHAQASASGTVVAWGWNAYGQSSVPSDLSGVTAIDGGYYHSLALKSDGTVVAWGLNNWGQISVPSDLSGVTAIAAGYQHSLALKADGTVVAWGWNYYGQSSVPAGLSGVIAIAAGQAHSLALKGDGTVVAWGYNEFGQTAVPAGLSGVTAIAAGHHSLALKGDGTVVAWGLNNFGQSSVPSDLSGVTSIAASTYHSLTLKGDGTVVAWGLNNFGQSSVPGDLNGVTAIAAGYQHSLALKGDGTIIAWGDDAYGQSSVPADLSGVTAIAAGDYHSLAVISSPAPDLAITQVADHATVSTGDPVGFTVTITNNGNGTANNVTLTDTLPIYPELSWSVSGTDAASCTITEAIVSCNFGDMPPGEVKTIRLTSPTQYISGTGFCPIIISVADVMATNQPEERSASANTTVLCPYVYISVWSDTPDVTAGDPISFTISVGNTGDGIAKDVEVVTGLPNKPGLSWSITNVTPASAAGNCNIDTTETYTEILCFFDQMAPLEEILITVTSPTTLDSCGELRSAGSVKFSNGLDHKSKVATIVVNCPASPSPPLVTTQPQSQAVYVGDTVGFSTAASGDPAPGLQWQVSTDSGTSWTDIAEATASPLTFTAALDQNGNQYRAVFTNSAGSATSDAAALSVSKKSATVTLTDLYQPYDGQPKPVTVTTDPVGLSVVVTYNGLPTAPTAAGSYPVVATINDATYQGSLSGTLTIQKRVAYVTPYDAYKLYGTQDPVLMGFLVNFIEADGVTATYSRTPGEAVGSYTILGALNPNEKLVNYNITYHTRTLTINPRPVTVTADAKTKVAGEFDPSLTYNITSGSLAFSDAFNGALIRDPGEEAGVYAIRQGTLALDSNYTLTYVGANLTILPASVNTASIANPGGPYLGAINTAISFDGSLSSDADGDPLTYTWSFGDGGTAASAMPNHTYTAAGIYDTCLTVNDGTEDSEMVCTIAVVYDPSAGFVSGSGWIDSPAGAYLLDPSLAGRARFGFVSKYQKGATVPTGHTEFRFDAGRFNFHSETYEWLVVNTGGTNAQFKGSGLVNGALDPNGNAYMFMLWATDGATSGGPDTFRIRIWWEDAAGEHDVYDNGVDQAISGGSIVVHTKK
jgi:uncharacterized repeat protein (TIGR01451 family)